MKNIESLAWKDFLAGRGRPVEARHGPTVPISEVDVPGLERDVVTDMIDAEEFAMAGVKLERFLRSLSGPEQFIFDQSQLKNRPLSEIATHLNMDSKNVMRVLKTVINRFRQFVDRSAGGHY